MGKKGAVSNLLCNSQQTSGRSYASGLVLGSPTTLEPSFHCPRFFSNSTRSNRLRTFLFAAMVLAPLKLRCWDITKRNDFYSKTSREGKPAFVFFKPSRLKVSDSHGVEEIPFWLRSPFGTGLALQLIAQDHVTAARSKLMENVEAFRQQVLPVG